MVLVVVVNAISLLLLLPRTPESLGIFDVMATESLNPSKPWSQSAKFSRSPCSRQNQNLIFLVVIRERFEGVEGTGEERKQAMDAAYNKSVAADVLRMPKTGRGASDSVGDLGKGEGQGGGGVPVIEFGDDDVEEMMDLLTPKEQALVQQIRGEVDLQIQDFREKQEAICFGTEELICDKLRWWPKDKHPKYE
jgi:hypothetical protein